MPAQRQRGQHDAGVTLMLELVGPADWQPAGCRIVVTTRFGGVSGGAFDALNLADHVGDDPAAVAENRRRLADAIGCARIQWLRQVHGSRCVRATARTAAGVPEADAVWTRETDLALAVLTADCVPVVFAAPAADLIGIAHAGWRGLVGGVLEAALAAMPVPAADVEAWLGPAIGAADYQVDDTLARAILALPDGRALAARVLLPDPAPGRHRLDLFELATALLERRGVRTVRSERISTCADPRFYSHRRDGQVTAPTGRFATLVWRPRA
jgi:YfiH family protein